MRTKTEAVVQFDEFDNAETWEIARLNELLLDCRLDDQGRLQLNRIGDSCEDEV